ncbi:Cytochrome p450 [Colletotrichum higginsianum IMI 349063]|uniref:Cytochrome p450 n=3 Tax=Colletotrichum higginsianum TaxID=80884 RepID=A0A1B7YEJ2_COLHI|nr:Cytochrome p450 [Colletotrichum higginsianum IMI 349063]OBR10442.1 Cytochrome p450 [Colletotrichum higginsianum IMI 349063]TID06624.1 Cytochrome P450 3A11 [Colletotrichum higginsianum]
MAGFLAVAAAAAVAVAAILRLVYLGLLPRPIPGIPCNKDSTTRLMGDAPYFIELGKSGAFWITFFTDLLARHNTPIAQYFTGPLSGSHVVVADYREARDLMTKRGKDLARGSKNNHVWQGVLPEHFIAMEDFHPSFKHAKFLTKDLMTPSFLHGVSAPASYKTVVNFIKFWKRKAVLADGLPFDAAEDLEGFTYDIMMTAAFGIAEQDSHTVDRLNTPQTAKDVRLVGDGPGKVAEFPPIKIPEMISALHVLNDSLNGAFWLGKPAVFHAVNNLRPSVRRAFGSKRSIIQSHIDRSVEKQLSSRGGSKEDFASAVDYVISREISAAGNDGRRPVFDSLRLNDMLWGYFVGGHDSTHSTLCFTVKYLGDNQDAQSRLRGALRAAYPEAREQGREPTVDEIVKTQVPFLDAFIEETLRLCSPAGGVTKQTLCDMTVLGHFIPKGTTILFLLTGPTINLPGAEVDEARRSETSQKTSGEGVGDWSRSRFPPGEFHAERWLHADENGGSVRFDNRAGPFLSFSNGPRGCWGKRLAYLELKLIITLLVWDLKFARLPEELRDDGLVQGLFTKPKSCLVKLESLSVTG